MKKFLTVALAALMIFQSFAVCAASYGNVGTDLALDVKAQDSEYAAEATIEAGDKVDFKATVGMADVQAQFLAVVADADAFLEGYFENDGKVENAKADLREVTFSKGDFDFTLTYPTAINLPKSVVEGKEMKGFNEEAKLAFEEVKRVNTVKGAVSTLVITLKVKEDVTIGEIEADIDEYLGDMTFEGEGVAASKVGTFAITGNMAGEVSAAFTFDKAIGELVKDITFSGKEDAVATVIVNPETYTVTGAVTGIDDAAEVTAKLVKGAVETEVVVNEDGTFEIASVDFGTYNLVVTSGTKTVTVVVDVKDDVTVDVAFPVENISTIVTDETTEDSAANDVVVGQTDKIAEETVVADAITEAGADGSVEVKTSILDIIIEVIEAIAEKAEEFVDNYDAEKSKVEPLAAAKTEVIVKDNTGTQVGESKQVDKLSDGSAMHLAMNFPTSGKKDFAIIKSTNDGVENIVEALEEDTTNSGLPGTFYIDEENDMIHIYSADATADFAVAYNEVEDETITETPDDEDEDEDDYTPSRKPSNGIPGSGSVSDTVKPVTVLPFTDVAEDAWYYDSVKYVYENGLFKGVTETTFEPDTAITRGMFVTVLGRKSSVVEGVVATEFEDVAADAYYAAYIKWATDNGIVQGYGDGTFGPDDIITREQMATIILRYRTFIGRGPVGAWAVEIPYADTADISEYAVEGVMYCYKEGIMTGKNDNMFDPQGSATRAEVSAVMERSAL